MGSGQGGRHGAARRPGSGSAATCAQTSASARGPAQSLRPSSAAAAARGACHPSAAWNAGVCSEGSLSPAPDLGHPPRLTCTAALGYGRATPARQGDFSLSSLRGKLRHASRKRLTHAQKREISPSSQQGSHSLEACRGGRLRTRHLGRGIPEGGHSLGP